MDAQKRMRVEVVYEKVSLNIFSTSIQEFQTTRYMFSNLKFLTHGHCVGCGLLIDIVDCCVYTGKSQPYHISTFNL